MKKVRAKRWMSIFLSFLLVFSYFGTASASSDVEGHWAEAELKDWVEKGLVKGFPDGSIRPGATISRAEFVTLVNRAFGFEEEAGEGFSDVSSSDWYYGEVLKAKAAGYISGDGDGHFRPKSAITRQEAAVIVGKLLKLDEVPDGVASFKDEVTIPAWSKGFIGAAAEKGFLKGFSDGEFKPFRDLNRAEAIVVLDRVVNSVAFIFDEAGTFGPDEGTETIVGNVSISAANVTLKNLIIEGNLTIEESVGDGNVYLKGVTVKGKTIVKGGGENSIHFEDTVLLTVIVNKADGTVRIVATGATTVKQVELYSGAKVEDNAVGAGFQAVELAASLPANSKVTLLGEFESVEIKATTVSVSIPKGVVKDLIVDSASSGTILDLAQGSRIVSLVLNAAVSVLGTGTIDNAEVNANGTTFQQAPTNLKLSEGVTTNAPKPSENSGSSGSSGGSGGGGSNTPPPNQIPDEEEPGEDTAPDTVIEKGEDLQFIGGGRLSASFTWKSNNGIGSIGEEQSGSYKYYDDGAYLRFQVKDKDGNILKFADIFETGSAVNDVVGGMTLQTNDGPVNDMDGSKRERADWGVEGENLDSYKTNLPNDGNYVFYGLIQSAEIGTKTVGFAPGDERTVKMTFTLRAHLEPGEYSIIVETLQQGNDVVQSSISYLFEMPNAFASTEDVDFNGKIDTIIIAAYDFESDEMIVLKGTTLNAEEGEIEVEGYNVLSAKTHSSGIIYATIEEEDLDSDYFEGSGEEGEFLIIRIEEKDNYDTDVIPRVKINKKLETIGGEEISLFVLVEDFSSPVAFINESTCQNCVKLEFSEMVSFSKIQLEETMGAVEEDDGDEDEIQLEYVLSDDKRSATIYLPEDVEVVEGLKIHIGIFDMSLMKNDSFFTLTYTDEVWEISAPLS